MPAKFFAAGTASSRTTAPLPSSTRSMGFFMGALKCI
jgi:hypothetical protein